MKLSAKVSLLISLLVIMIVSGISILLMVAEKQYLVREIGKNQISLINGLKRVSIEALRRDDDLFLLNYVKTIEESDKTIAYAMFVDKDNRILAHTDSKLLRKSIDDPVGIKAQASKKLLIQSYRMIWVPGAPEIVDVSFPVFLGAKRKGTARIGFSKRILEETVKETLRKTRHRILVVSSIILIFGVFGVLIITNTITRPIKMLAKGVDLISQGQFDIKIKVRGRNELNWLANKFNKMSKDLKKSRDEIISAKDYTDNIIKSMIDTLIVTDPEGKIKTVNQATLDLLAYEEQDIIGKPAGILFAEVTPFKGTRMKRLIEEGTVRDYDMKYRTKKGEVIPVSFSGSVMRDKEGELVGIVGIARDMREIKRLMQKEKKLAAQAAAAETDRKRADELEKAYKELKETRDILIQAEKLNAIGQLASGVAHEVRNPLGIIVQGVDYLEKRISPKQEDIVGTLTMLKDSVKRADKIINSLLDFSRATKLDLQPEDINSILEDSLTLVKTRFKFENINIVRETKKDIPKVLADKNKIEQVFVNILLNAIQAMPKGGKIIIRSFSKQLGEVKNGIGRGEKAVIVEIEDTGTGIPEERLKRVFDPFFTTRGPSGGSGLGLSVSRNIINMHKGLIDIKSQINKGTKVIITLKIAGR